MKKQNLLRKLIFLFVWLLAITQGFSQTWITYDGAAPVTSPNSSGVTFTTGDVQAPSLSSRVDTLANGNKTFRYWGATAARNSYRWQPTLTYATMPEQGTVMVRTRSRDSLGTAYNDHGFEIEFYIKRSDTLVSTSMCMKFILYQACSDSLYFEDPSSSTARRIYFPKSEQLKWHTYRLTVDTIGGTKGNCKLYIDENSTPAFAFRTKTTTSNKFTGKIGAPFAAKMKTLRAEVDWMAWDYTNAFTPSSNLPSKVFVDGYDVASAKAITAFSFASPAATGTIDEGAKTIAITVPKYTDVTALTPTIVNSRGSFVTPSGPVNFTSPVTFTVAAEDFSTQTYQATVTVATLNDKKAITAFSIPGQIGSSVINTTAHTVDVTMPFGSIVTDLAPTIAVSLDATIAPLSGAAQNFTSTVNYTVTAEDATTQVWAVTVSIAPNTATYITTFDFNGLTPPVVGVPDTTQKIVRLTVPYGTDLTTLVPTIVLSPNATVSPLSGVAQNFTDTVVYTVTAGDGITTKNWKVKVAVTPAATDPTLSDLKVNGTTVADFSPGTTLYRYLVPSGTSIVPTVTATKNNVFATVLITPAASIPDTTKVLVTAQNGSTMTYNVYFYHPSTDVWTIYDGSKTLDDPTNTYPFTLSHGSAGVVEPTDTVVDDLDIPGNKVIRFESLAACQNLFTINPYGIASDSSKLTIILRLRDYKDSIIDNVHHITVVAEKNSDLDIYYAGYREKWFGQNKTPYTKPNIKAEKRNQSGAVYGVDSVHVNDVAHWHIYRIVIDTAIGTRLYVDEKLDSVNGGYFNWLTGAAASFRLALGDGSQSTSYSALYDYVIWTKGAYAPGEGPAIPPQLSTTFWNDSTLSELKINDTVYTAFNPKKLTYLITLPDTTTIVPKVTYTIHNSNATALITPATSVPGATTIVVTAEDGTSKATYTLNFTVAGAKSTISSLDSLFVSGTEVPGFASATLSYNMALAPGTTIVPVVTAVVTDSTATYVVTPAASLPGTTTILVTAEDTSFTTTYVIHFTVTKSTDATLTGITYNATAIPNFKPGTHNYTIVLPFGTTVVPTLTVTKSYPAATFVIIPTPTLPGTDTVVVTAEDGVTKSKYNVKFLVSTVGVASISENTISCYPNPAKNFLNIKLGNSMRKGNVYLYNLLGEVALSKSLNGSETLDISSLKKGLYLVKINVDGKFYIQKIEVLK